MSRIVKATKWTTVSTVVTIALTILQISILTRYLEPSTYGYFAIINLAIEVFTAMALGGISSFIIYKKEISQQAKNTIFGLVIITGAIAFIFFYFVGPLLTSLLGYPILEGPMELAAILLPLSAISSQYQAIGLKSFEHDKVAKVEITAKFASFIIAINTTELGIFCLLTSYVSYYIFRLLGLMLLFSKVVDFSLKFEKSIVREAFNYGIFEFGTQTLNIVRRQLDVLILSMTLSANDLGIYHVIKQLASRPAMAVQPVVNKVALPTFSGLQENITKLKETYLDFMGAQSFVLAFFYAPIIIFSDLVAAFLLGDEYASQYIILSLLAAFWFIRVASSNLIGPIVLSSGKTKANFYWNLGIILPNIAMIYFSSSHGVMTLAIALIIFQLIVVPTANKLVVGQVLDVEATRIFLNMAIPFTIISAPLVALKLVFEQLSIDLYLVKEAIIALLTIATFYACFKFIPSIRDGLLRLKKG